MPLSRKKILSFLQTHRCLLLLVVLLLALLFEPLALGNRAVEMVFVGIIGLIFIFGPYWVTQSTAVLVITVVWLTVLALSRFVEYVLEWPDVYVALLTIGMVMDLLVISSLLIYLVNARFVTRDHIFGSLLAYFLLAIFFAQSFNALHGINPESFDFGKLEHATRTQKLDIFLYFSLTTITTSSYGDVLPATPFARRICALEACIGVLYVAVFIGHIIGMHNDRRAQSQSL
jgi:hypothetical protein